MLLLGAWYPAVTCSQCLGSARVNGVETDFYRVPAPAADRPYPMPPHPKWLAGGERPAFAQQLSRLRRQPRLDTPSDRPHAATQGKVLGVCLLVDFTDRLAQAPWTRQHYLDMLFSLGTYASGSLRDYFLEDSYGLLDVRGTVVNGSGGNLAGWFRAPQTHAWYCNNQQGLGPYPQNAQKLVEDAIALADPVVDFSRYASGGSGTMVDLLHVVHAGSSSELSKLTTDFATCKWSTSAVVSVEPLKSTRTGPASTWRTRPSVSTRRGSTR